MSLPRAREGGPVHGPYAEAWFDAVEQVYRIRLTVEGQEKVAEYLARHPRPMGLLISTWPGTYQAARAARFTNEESESYCLEGVALAFARYDPARQASIRAVVAWGVRGAVRNAVLEARRAAAILKPVAIDRLVGSSRRDWEERDALSSLDLREQLNRYFTAARLTQKERFALARRFGLADCTPSTQVSTGVAMGLSRQRVQQLQEKALVKIREVLGLDGDRR
jgi:hypothetical protein